MKFFDLHCDTALALWHKQASLFDNDCHISLQKAAYLEKYVQCMAFFTAPKLSDAEGWNAFCAAYDYLLAELKKNNIPVLRSAADLEAFAQSPAKVAVILTIEDVRILDGKIERVRALYDRGIRVVTPLWGGLTSIGGSHDTDAGLSDFGREAVREMLRVGILPDLSHASFASADEILTLCEETGRTVIATHMNSYTVRAHSRNLTDDRLARLVRLDGLVGVSFCPPHLTGETPCTADHIVDHLAYYQTHAPGHTAYGTDFDGTGLPDGMDDLTAIPKTTALLEKRGVPAIDAITWGNAYRFFQTYLPKA